MISIEKQKALLREKLKDFKEGEDYAVSFELDAWKGKIKIYTVYSLRLKKDLWAILSSISDLEDDKGYIYEIKESATSISVSRTLTVNPSSSEEDWERFRRNLPENSPQIREVTDQEAQEIQHQQQPFFPERRGN